MTEYYYIKIKSIEYDKSDLFLTNEGLSTSPEGIRVFNDLDDAIDIKKIMRGEHKGYIVDIVRF